VRGAVIMLGCMEVQTGVADLVLAGGAESMSQAEFYAMGMRWGVKGGSVMLEDRRGARDERDLRERRAYGRVGRLR
jgi:acetyl-CoA acetyltransferase